MTQTTMEHDLKDGVFFGEAGKKRARGAMEDFLVREVIDSSMARHRRFVEVNHLSSAAVKRQGDRSQ